MYHLAVRTAFGDFTLYWTVSVASLQLKTCLLNELHQLLSESLRAVEVILSTEIVDLL